MMSSCCFFCLSPVSYLFFFFNQGDQVRATPKELHDMDQR